MDSITKEELVIEDQNRELVTHMNCKFNSVGVLHYVRYVST